MLYRLSLFLINAFAYCALNSHEIIAQNVINNGIIAQGGSDNTGGSKQIGLEVIQSTSKVGVSFDIGGTFEHVGQFYIAQDGSWNSSSAGSTDYFGYAPTGIGSNLPYQGLGILGASANNGGRGAGTPIFGNLELNSTGVFPLAAGMYIANSLLFNANGPGGSNIITTPAMSTPDSPTNAVTFAPTASVTGANSTNYISGYASVTNPTNPFTLPLGDARSPDNPLHTLTINNAVSGTITARYLYITQHPVASLGAGIKWVSPIADWSISAPKGTVITVDIPALPLSTDDASYLRLVGWNGHQWVNLSEAATPGTCTTGNCPLQGTLTDYITDLAIGLTRKPTKEADLTVWPSPTQGPLYLAVSADKTIDKIQVVNQQGHIQLNLSKHTLPSGLDVSALPAGSYLLEVHTTEGHTFRQRFIRQ